MHVIYRNANEFVTSFGKQMLRSWLFMVMPLSSKMLEIKTHALMQERLKLKMKSIIWYSYTVKQINSL